MLGLLSVLNRDLICEFIGTGWCDPKTVRKLHSLSAEVKEANTFLGDCRPKDRLRNQICEFLDNGYDLKTILKFHSRFVEVREAITFLGTFGSSGLVITDHKLYTDNFPDDLVGWCVKHRIKFTAFAIGYRTRTCLSPELMASFFQLNGPVVTSFVLHSDSTMDDTAWLVGLAENCLTLKALEIIKDIEVDDEFMQLLHKVLRRHSTTLERIDISIKGREAIFPDDVTFTAMSVSSDAPFLPFI